MSSWDTTTGLMEVFTLEVKEAWFGFNDKYQGGKVLALNFKGPASVDGDVVDPENHIWYGCGPTWKDAQGGASAINTTGADGFSENTNMGRLINSVKKLGDDALAVMKGRGESFEAETWLGLSLDLERTHVSTFPDKVTGDPIEVHTNLVTGLREGSAPAAAPAVTEGDTTPTSVNPKVLRVYLTKEAKSHADNDAFMSAVLDNGYEHSAALTDNEEILDEVIDGSLYAEAN